MPNLITPDTVVLPPYVDVNTEAQPKYVPIPSATPGAGVNAIAPDSGYIEILLTLFIRVTTDASVVNRQPVLFYFDDTGAIAAESRPLDVQTATQTIAYQFDGAFTGSWEQKPNFMGAPCCGIPLLPGWSAQFVLGNQTLNDQILGGLAYLAQFPTQGGSPGELPASPPKPVMQPMGVRGA